MKNCRIPEIKQPLEKMVKEQSDAEIVKFV